MKSEIFYKNPNLSIVLPGGCQAHCQFCFWYQKPTDPQWIQKLIHTLDTLPACFEQVSITGGEPTLSPYLLQTLQILASRRGKYKKIVMTTNGIRLMNYINEVSNGVDHINISRHHWLEEKNQEVFKTANVPTTSQLREMADMFRNKLTFNCVISDMSVDDMHKFLVYARVDAGVNNVCFRQEHGSLDPVAIEKYLLSNYKKTSEGGCPVCRGSYFDVNGMSVGIKYSVLEPKDVIDGIYELVLHPDGKLSADWEANIEIDLVKE